MKLLIEIELEEKDLPAELTLEGVASRLGGILIEHGGDCDIPFSATVTNNQGEIVRESK